eukprot:scaffold7092_cov262-Pinguiococcus_pyrenoidosus.AAC.18
MDCSCCRLPGPSLLRCAARCPRPAACPAARARPWRIGPCCLLRSPSPSFRSPCRRCSHSTPLLAPAHCRPGYHRTCQRPLGTPASASVAASPRMDARRCPPSSRKPPR